MAHTPGPWTAQSSDLPGGFLEIISPSYRKETDAEHVVCELRRWRRPSPEDDARLIAAAPELLAACHAALGVIQYLLANDDNGTAETCLEILAEALNNAEGRAE